MRLIGAASIVFALAFTFAVAEFPPALTASQPDNGSDSHDRDRDRDDDERNIEGGRPSSATTPSATSSCGPMCCGCTK